MSLIVDIKKDFGAFQLDMAFEAENGTLGLLGASGCGKSMTLQCIAGIVKPDSGHISLDGRTLFDSKRKIDLPPQSRKVGYLFQNYALFPNMTVRQNILCGLRWEKSRQTREAALAQILRRMGLEKLEQHKPAQLSGGQQQRTALARILVSRPQVLMLDEPFSALDNHLREKLQVEMKGMLAQYGGISLLVTHNRDEAYRICQRIALVDRGSAITLQETKQLFANPGSIAAAVMTGCKNIAPAFKTGEFQVEVPDWGVTLTAAMPIGEGLRAVGIRAHSFGSQIMENRFSVQLSQAIEEPFELTIPFRYGNQQPDAPELWWRLPKAQCPMQPECRLGVAAKDVLLLY